MMHTDEEDFQHFLSYSGFRLSESPETIAKLKKAFMAGCPAPKPETDGDARIALQAIKELSQLIKCDQPRMSAWAKDGAEAVARMSALLANARQGESWTDPETGLVFYSMTAQEYAAIWNGWEKEKAEIQQGERALRVCGNCLHGRGTSLDDTRCYKATPYLPTGRHCEACADWEPCGTCANPKSAAPLASHDESDTIHNTGSVSHDNREPDGRKGE